MFANLANLLPILALAGLALEAVPATASNHIAVQRDVHHARAAAALAGRHVTSGSKRSSAKKCRPRPAPATTSTVAVTTDAPGATGASPTPDAGSPTDGGAGSTVPSAGSPSPSAGSDVPSTGSDSAVPSAPSSAAPQPTDNSPAPVTGRKLVLAWPNNGGVDPGPWLQMSDKYYTWGSSPDPLIKSSSPNTAFYPMFWGTSQDRIDKWYSDQDNWGPDVNLALFLNEPELMDNPKLSSGVTPEAAADAWLNHFIPSLQKDGRNIKRASAALASGKDWHHQFNASCHTKASSPDQCDWDITAVHSYTIDINEFQAYINDMHDTFGKDIIVTEYSCMDFVNHETPSYTQIKQFHEEAKAFLESKTWIVGYAPFGVMEDMVNVNPDNALMDAGGSPTELGKVYAK